MESEIDSLIESACLAFVFFFIMKVGLEASLGIYYNLIFREWLQKHNLKKNFKINNSDYSIFINIRYT